MLDLFAGRLGVARVFAARGWEVTAIDILEPPEIPPGVQFIKADVLMMGYDSNLYGYVIVQHPASRLIGNYDFGWASSPCEEFSVFGMRHFNPHPKHPEMGMKLWTRARRLFEQAGIPYVMENVRAAQEFVGPAQQHSGPFYLWGNAVPPLMPQGIRKGMDTGGALSARGASRDEIREYCKANRLSGAFNSKSKERMEIRARNATIPPELANCVADYAERLLSSELERNLSQ